MADKLPRYYSQDELPSPSVSPYGNPSALAFGDGGFGQMAETANFLSKAAGDLARQRIHADRVDSVSKATVGAAKEISVLAYASTDVNEFDARAKEIMNKYAEELGDPYSASMFRKQISFMALSQYQGVARKAFELDQQTKQGSLINTLAEYRRLASQHQDVEGLESYIKDHNILIAALTVPAGAAPAVANQLVNAGVKAILNYAPVTLRLPEGVVVSYIDPVLALQRMTYYLPR